MALLFAERCLIAGPALILQEKKEDCLETHFTIGFISVNLLEKFVEIIPYI